MLLRRAVELTLAGQPSALSLPTCTNCRCRALLAPRQNSARIPNRCQAGSGKEEELAVRDPAGNPWPFGFQVSERTLVWSDHAQRRLLKIHAAQSLGKDIQWIDDRLERLAELLPDLMGKLELMKAEMMLTLVANCEGIAQKAVELKVLLPNTNVSQLIAKFPAILLSLKVGHVREQLGKMREVFGPDRDVESIVAKEPALLAANLTDVLSEMTRLMPSQKDPVGFLAANPGIVLDMQSLGLPSTIDGDLTQEP